MNDPLVLALFLGTWLAGLWAWHRFADDVKQAGTATAANADGERAAVTRLAADIERVADEIDHVLAVRTERLQALIDDADRRIAELDERVRSTDGTAESYDGPAPVTPVAPVALAAPALPAPPVAPVAPVASVASVAPASPAPPARPAPPAEAVAGRRGSVEDVWRLTSEGHDTDTIARLTNRGREEVRLLLQRRQLAADAPGR